MKNLVHPEITELPKEVILYKQERKELKELSYLALWTEN